MRIAQPVDEKTFAKHKLKEVVEQAEIWIVEQSPDHGSYDGGKRHRNHGYGSKYFPPFDYYVEK